MTFKTCRPKGTKPSVGQLRAEIERRASVHDVSIPPRPGWTLPMGKICHMVGERRGRACKSRSEEYKTCTWGPQGWLSMTSNHKCFAYIDKPHRRVRKIKQHKGAIQFGCEKKIVQPECGYGRSSITTINPGSPPSESPTTALRWSRVRCVPRMMNVFVFLKDEFINRYKTIPHYKIDDKDKNWVLESCGNIFQQKKLGWCKFQPLLNWPGISLITVATGPIHYREGFTVSAIKLRNEFRDIRALFIKALASFRKS